MTEEERHYVEGLLQVGRSTVYALDRTLRLDRKLRRGQRLVLQRDLDRVQAEVDRLTLVLGA